MDDLISRQEAIDAVKEERFPIDSDYAEGFMAALDKVEWILKEWLPSAQPETHEERTETHACDLISRQAAISVIAKWMLEYGGEGEERERNALKQAAEEIKDLPSAQPEPCVDTIDALDESIKHFDDMAEECRRNANIEQNDYMDMRDDAAEYRQLSIWLNELKWLRERFQSQPDLSEYSDKLWKKAYERGRAEALAQLEEAYISGETEAEARFYKRKKGKWIKERGRGLAYKCSACGNHLDFRDVNNANYCPNCGADMREPEDIPMEYFESGGR